MTWRILRKIILGILFLSISSSNALELKKYKLFYKLPNETKFKLNSFRDDYYEMDYLGNETVTNSTNKFEYLLEVKNITDNGMELEVVYKNVTFVSDHPQYTGPPDFSELINKKVSVFLSTRGVVTKFKGFNNLPEITLPGKGMINEEKYTIPLKVLFPKLPDKPVQIGDQWDKKLTFEEHEGNSIFEIIALYSYTLIEETEKDSKPCLKIKSEYTIEVTGKGDMQGMPFIAKMLGKGTETIYFDFVKGMLIEITGDSDIKGSADFKEDEFSIPMYHKFKEGVTVEIFE